MHTHRVIIKNEHIKWLYLHKCWQFYIMLRWLLCECARNCKQNWEHYITSKSFFGTTWTIVSNTLCIINLIWFLTRPKYAVWSWSCPMKFCRVPSIFAYHSNVSQTWKNDFTFKTSGAESFNPNSLRSIYKVLERNKNKSVFYDRLWFINSFWEMFYSLWL